ncbi:Peptidase C15 pyroglutamyl peptidase I [Penicillium argentinense]|uniref:Peptidase C15 pyroglutamyl peptidase I n=1 Tax=Penicillium argentinense TaxID=1131581 RepID=A0A9W9FLY4_9EURO|nr:Peptidase C15 pyroglutamyl peptidase I [Penicillium argentinense]KAJ5102669.1 Peptidase C15 pyroglutamyl peptidase I [Penicillium argentinense]
MGDFGAVTQTQTSTPAGTPCPAPTSREISVLITGFGPFKTNLVNASYLIASSLPSSFAYPTKDGIDRRVSLHVHPTPIPVAYATVRETLPTILEEYAAAHDNRRPDLIIHIGIASPRLYYSVESLAHRDDYNITDINGRSGYEDGEKRWRGLGLPPILKPGPADPSTPGVLSNPSPPGDHFLECWKELAPPDTDIRISHDAGHYLCDFIYYTSMSLAFRAGHDRNVLFLHVPGASEDANIERGRKVAIALIKSMVTCWIDEKHVAV